MSRFVATLAFVLALVVAAPGAATATETASKPQVCGIPPGDGAYSFVRVWNISCERAQKVASNAYEHYCDENSCDTPPTGGIVKGPVSFNGWDCKVKLGYEFFRAVCEKPGVRLVSEGGA